MCVNFLLVHDDFTKYMLATLVDTPGLGAASAVLKQISQQCEAAVWKKVPWFATYPLHI
jgi:hypothetical protein